MLSKESKKSMQFKFPPKINLVYSDFKRVMDTSSYEVFEAKNRFTDEKHFIQRKRMSIKTMIMQLLSLFKSSFVSNTINPDPY